MHFIGNEFQFVHSYLSTLSTYTAFWTTFPTTWAADFQHALQFQMSEDEFEKEGVCIDDHLPACYCNALKHLLETANILKLLMNHFDLETILIKDSFCTKCRSANMLEQEWRGKVLTDLLLLQVPTAGPHHPLNKGY